MPKTKTPTAKKPTPADHQLSDDIRLGAEQAVSLDDLAKVIDGAPWLFPTGVVTMADRPPADEVQKAYGAIYRAYIRLADRLKRFIEPELPAMPPLRDDPFAGILAIRGLCLEYERRHITATRESRNFFLKPDEGKPPLSDHERKAFNIIRSLPAGEAITLKDLSKRTGIDPGVLTTHVMPFLKRHYSVKNRTSVGYYIDQPIGKTTC